MTDKNRKRILVTGAKGYVGSRLVSLLLNKKYKVRVVSTNPKKTLHIFLGKEQRSRIC